MKNIQVKKTINQHKTKSVCYQHTEITTAFAKHFNTPDPHTRELSFQIVRWGLLREYSLENSVCHFTPPAI